MRHVLNRERRQKLVSALILSRVDYCNSVLVGLPFNTISPLRRLLNAAARFVAGLRSRDHVTAALRDLHWLKIDQRITLKLCVLTIDAFNCLWLFTSVYSGYGYVSFITTISFSSSFCICWNV